MNYCSTCKKDFIWKGIEWHGGKEVFCSLNCLPEGALDEDLAIQYVSLVQSFSTFEDPIIIGSYFEQQELLDEVDYIITQSEEYVLGDTDGSFYKEKLIELHNVLCNIKEKIASYFNEKENFHVDYGLHIGWEFVKLEKSEEVATDLQKRLQHVMYEFTDQPTILYNQELDAINESQNIIYFNDGGTIDDGIHPYIEELYELGKTFLESIKVEDLSMVSYIELAKCPKCGIMEPWEDFSYNENYNLLACWSC